MSAGLEESLLLAPRLERRLGLGGLRRHALRVALLAPRRELELEVLLLLELRLGGRQGGNLHIK